MELKLNKVTLDDKYSLDKGRIYITGTQALVRLPIIQRQKDKSENLNTAAFISGYRGSPLGMYDKTLWTAKKFLKNNEINFESGLNEDLAATAVWGSQQSGLISKSTKDGIFGIWYGKGPGVDRSGDAFKHANSAGTSPHGGVLALLGDDHTAKSSTLAHQSEYAMVDAQIPILNPSNVQELLDYGLLGIALSRYAGIWVSMKCVTATMDSSASVNIELDRIKIIKPDFEMPPEGVHIRWPDMDILKQEKRLTNIKLPAVKAFVKANKINHSVWSEGKKNIGIVATGKGYAEVRQALSDLGIDEKYANKIGLHLFKVGVSWPLEESSIIDFCKDMEEVIVFEEKRPLIEDQIKEILFNKINRPKIIIGKRDEQDKELIPSTGELTPDFVSEIIADRITRNKKDENLLNKLRIIKQNEPDTAVVQGIANRTPYFCSGCPHNSSTKIPKGSKAMAGIGCHFMATWMDRGTDLFTHMGGEGANWIGMSAFVEDNHIFQNIGDGTYTHSGILAIRASVAAKVNITYKILFNDATAMTGGQPTEGVPTPSRISHQLYGEGVKRIAVVSDEPEKYGINANFAEGTTINHRSEIDQVQKELRAWPGVTAMIYDQTCATEKRRRRKRGLMEDPDKRSFINDEVCEGCGDCSKASNCISVEPLETKFGRKRKINQSSCNKDFSCVDGFCPSFVTVQGATPKKRKITSASDLPKDIFNKLPKPKEINIDKPFDIVVTGIGGTGVVTIGALIGMASHMENKGVSVLDQVGVAQKGGAVLSHIRIASAPEKIHSVKVGKTSADLILGCDMVVVSTSPVRELMNINSTHSVINDHETPVAGFVLDPDHSFGGKRIRQLIEQSSKATNFINSIKIATAMFGDSIASNMFITGYALQKGFIPVQPESMEEAIKLNNIAVNMNISAFRWGRMAAYDYDYVVKEAAPYMNNIEIDKDKYGINDIIKDRTSFLTNYQNKQYSDTYLDFIKKIIVKENNIEKGKEDLSIAVAKYLYKLMAYKDEYEVARLYTDGKFKEKLNNTFDGKLKLKFHVAPPLFAPKDPNTGKLKKITLGSWILPVFKILAKFKFLRGTMLDPFGKTKERKMERFLINQYKEDIERILKEVNSKNISLAVEIASIPEIIRGYGHVKEDNIKKAAIERDRLLNLWNISSDPNSFNKENITQSDSQSEKIMFG
jgi:indolepyruvate ferredoxin oxidoreductase